MALGKTSVRFFSCPDFIHSVHNDRKIYLFQGFPCNQFARQEPAANYTELYNGMAWVRPGMQRGYNFYPFFPLTKKLEVNGKDAHPIFNHLKVKGMQGIFSCRLLLSTGNSFPPIFMKFWLWSYFCNVWSCEKFQIDWRNLVFQIIDFSFGFLWISQS